MAKDVPPSSIGALSYRPKPDERLIPRTLQFILAELPHWRDDPKRPVLSNEKQLNSSLCDFLDNRSRTDFPMVRFKHESLQGMFQTVDLGVHGTKVITTVGTRYYTIYQPFVVIEAKRLPAPTSDREREYVIGTDKATGAIQRFRLGLHGASVEAAVIVGYVEDRSVTHWHAKINQWIVELSSKPSVGGCAWSSADKLGELTRNDEQQTASSESNHQRPTSSCTTLVKLSHFWVVMSRGLFDH